MEILSVSLLVLLVICSFWIFYFDNIFWKVANNLIYDNESVFMEHGKRIRMESFCEEVFIWGILILICSLFF